MRPVSQLLRHCFYFIFPFYNTKNFVVKSLVDASIEFLKSLQKRLKNEEDMRLKLERGLQLLFQKELKQTKNPSSVLYIACLLLMLK